jgi:hypothetical protein
MIADARAELSAVQQELRRLDLLLAASDGDAPALVAAETLVALSKMRARVGKLVASLAPPSALVGPDGATGGQRKRNRRR